MNQYYFVILKVLYYLICSSSADLLEKPKTNIIEAFSVETENTNDVSESDNLKKSSPELCPVSENKSWKDLTSSNNIDVLSPELQPPLTNIANKDLAYQYAYTPGYNYYDLNTDPFTSPPPKIPDNSVVRSYNKLSYPYIYPEVFTSFQPYPVRYIPPVYLQYYYSLSPQDMMPNYEVSNIRTPRVLRSNDDFWEQLESDSIMKNILPTMPVPFLRNNNQPLIYERAYLPYGSPDCALPIMLGCAPKFFYRDHLAKYNREVVPVDKHIDQSK